MKFQVLCVEGKKNPTHGFSQWAAYTWLNFMKNFIDIGSDVSSAIAP